MQVGCVLVLRVTLFSYFLSVALGATLLPNDEVEALKKIAATLGKTNWNFSEDPCSIELVFSPKAPPGGADNVTCDCTFANSTICHVVSIDLTRNYLNGSIPKEWGSMQLQNISLCGNRLSGSLPIELGNITTLKSLALDYNRFSGFLPLEIGNLVTLDRMLVTSNNFTGQLPETLVNLISLTDFRISDNNFSGKVPSFFQNLTNLEKIVIQGSGLEGPIPLEIFLLTNISDLRSTDLNGGRVGFPPLSNMNNLKTLLIWMRLMRRWD